MVYLELRILYEVACADAGSQQADQHLTVAISGWVVHWLFAGVWMMWERGDRGGSLTSKHWCRDE
jgi:hypothetical protein